ncbi:MAG TPA: DMT family transporter [Gaiellaceae bacterium]|nr:DMT family transporter [Gaiellaceae bacterium]
MDAVLLALASAALFGAMTVALRPALARGAGAEAGALWTIASAAVVAALAAALRLHWEAAGLWWFAAVGVLGPGLSQLLFTLAVRDAGPARASVTVGTAPLFSVAIALLALGEPLVAGALAGAVLIVAGGLLLAGERGRPAHVRPIGLLFALCSTLVFATRDNLVRHLSLDTDVGPQLAAAATLAGGGLAIAVWLALARRPLEPRAWRRFAPAGVFFGLSYVFLFEAYERGRVSVVSPLVATESLFGVLLSALFLRRVELVGARLAVGAALIVAGGVLIGASR